MNNFVKVELGCGTTKNEGYIGIDRFPLLGVDIVADLDKGIPLEDNSVDIIFCSHSLEHFDNLSNIVNEIYRVCKHKAIVNILVPYHMESVNLANFYHKQVFNESTFRFFTNDVKTSLDIKDYYNPHASAWGLASSDNSNSTINLVTLSMECFYFPGYESFSDEEKRNARKSLVNVCDQIYYSLAINKSEQVFADSEIFELKEKAKHHEVPIINIIRNRKLDDKIGFNILNDIKKWDNLVLTKQKLAQNRLARRIDENNLNLFKLEQNLNEEISRSEYKLNEGFSNKLNLDKEELLQIINRNKMELSQNINDIENEFNKSFLKTIETIEGIKKDFEYGLEVLKKDNLILLQNIQNQLNLVTSEKNSLAAIVLDLVKEKDRNRYIDRKIHVFKKKHDMYYYICNHRNYTDGLILFNNNLTIRSILILSKIIPYNSYFEYRVFGYGKRINCFIISNIGAKLFIELVKDGEIVKQECITVMEEGPLNIILEQDIKGEIYIRFKTLDNYSIVRVLEISNRKFMFFSKKSLATYVD